VLVGRFGDTDLLLKVGENPGHGHVANQLREILCVSADLMAA
jgi:hypothetical protein